MIGLVIAMILQGLACFWLGTALVWFTVDWRVRPVRRRVWRALTWLPHTLADLLGGHW